MPTAIGNINQLVAVIQAQLSPRAGIRPTTRHSKAEKSRDKTSSRNPESLEALISERIRSIDHDDPNKGRKAFRVFLESVLLSHLGENLTNDPAFYQLVDDVQLAMEADRETADMIGIAISRLLIEPA
jgi:hypothetical protein